MNATLRPNPIGERYRIERELGRGAMGVVYLARDLRHDREVALKVLRGVEAEGVDQGRFTAEIRTAARLTHPHILPVHDSGSDGGMLWYVMPRVEGESLDQCLRRNGPLAVEEAVDLAGQVADALAYAHGHGVVHRDVKPANILLDGAGHAYLADFGLARALTERVSPRRTAASLTVGSPLYMSPEQAAPGREVDSRSDIYSLGCVLYEMLAGEAPFPGEDAGSVLARHANDDVPSLRRRRADVPPALEAAIATALAKDPADRFPTAAAFAAAIHPTTGAPAPAGGDGPGTVGERRWRRPVGLSVLTILVVGLLSYLAAWEAGLGWGAGGGAPALDSARYVVLPFRRERGVPDSLNDAFLLHEAFGRWRDLQLVDRLQVADALGVTGRSALTPDDALRVARELSAGRYVHGLITPSGDSLHFQAVLYDATDGSPLRRASLRLSREAVPSSAELYPLADSLLLHRGAATPPAESPGGTESLAAERAYGDGRVALDRWDLPAAESLFAAAVERDPGFGNASLWLAQVRNWAGAEGDRWREPAERALAAASSLSPRERLMAEGLAALAAGDYPRACTRYDSLRLRDDRDFAAWYGIGQCHARDPVVVRDRRSPSGWRFRGSYHRAVEAYRKAFQLLPSSHLGFRGNAFEQVREILYARGNRRRAGRAEGPDGELFVARPSLLRDTLAFIPYPHDRAEPVLSPSADQSHEAALIRQRQLFRDIAGAWSTAFPSSPDALHALAIAQDMLGDREALRSIRQARELARDRPGSEGTPGAGPGAGSPLSLDVTDVLLRVKFGVPDRPGEVAAARRLADSILSRTTPATPAEAGLLSELAVLIGRPARAAALARQGAQPATTLAPVPTAATRPAAALLAFAAAGGPADSIAALEAAVTAAIERAVLPEHRALVRSMLLERPAMLAFPAHTFALLTGGEPPLAAVARAQRAAIRGDVTGALATLRSVRNAQAGLRPEDRSLDILLPEACLLVELGHPDIAEARLASTLDALTWMHGELLHNPGLLGALPRAIALRAELAARRGDTAEAARWAPLVAALWEGGEPAVAPTLAAARRLGRDP